MRDTKSSKARPGAESLPWARLLSGSGALQSTRRSHRKIFRVSPGLFVPCVLHRVPRDKHYFYWWEGSHQEYTEWEAGRQVSIYLE